MWVLLPQRDGFIKFTPKIMWFTKEICFVKIFSDIKFCLKNKRVCGSYLVLVELNILHQSLTSWPHFVPICPWSWSLTLMHAWVWRIYIQDAANLLPMDQPTAKGTLGRKRWSQVPQPTCMAVGEPVFYFSNIFLQFVFKPKFQSDKRGS